MTIAAAYKIGQIPALLSDVLMSGLGEGQHQPIVTRVDLNEALPPEWQVRVTGLYRKSLVICETLAVAVAGNGLTASVIFRALKDAFSAKPPSKLALELFLGNLDGVAKPACTLVGWLVADGVARSFRWQSDQASTMQWDDSFVIGSGADLFQTIAWSPRQTEWHAIKTFDHAQHYGLMQISSLLVNELSNGQPVQNLFGGGYDLLLWDGTGFRHASSTSFIFLSRAYLQSQTKSPADAAPIVLRQAEVEDCLVVRAVIAQNQLGATSDRHERSAVIAPITSLGRHHTLKQLHDWDDTPLIADRVFVIIVGEGPTGDIEHWSGGVRDAEARLFRIEKVEGTGRVRFMLPTQILDNMMAAAEAQFNRSG